MTNTKNHLSIFTWHVHGTYLYYLSQGNFTIYIPVNKEKNEGYYGRGETFPFGDNVVEVDAAEVKNIRFDCVLFQSNKNWLADQFEILSEAQRNLPKIYLEHDPPPHDPTDTKHIVTDPDVIIVHVSNFNRLMWNNANSQIVKVIEHGVVDPKAVYTGELEKGIVIINNLFQRGRRLGADIFTEVSKRIPLDLIGMGTKEYGGLGEVLHPDLPGFISRYRFCFNPIRYTSLGLAVIEAMMAGLPVVSLATTEYVTMIRNYETGFISTDVDFLIHKMDLLLINARWAAQLGSNGRKCAEERFNIDRFIDDWSNTFEAAILKTENNEQKNRIYQ